MEFKKIMSVAMMMGAISFGASSASANNPAPSVLGTLAGVPAVACTTCHTTSNGPVLNAFGSDYKAAGGTIANNFTITSAQWVTLGALDSDGDGVTNQTELTAGTAPGVADAGGTGSTPTAPSAGGGGCMTESIAAPLTMALAMLTLGFFVRRKKD